MTHSPKMLESRFLHRQRRELIVEQCGLNDFADEDDGIAREGFIPHAALDVTERVLQNRRLCVGAWLPAHEVHFARIGARRFAQHARVFALSRRQHVYGKKAARAYQLQRA